MRKMSRGIAVIAAFAAASLPVTGGQIEVAGAATDGQSYGEDFLGAPGSPTQWSPPNWDVTVHSRGDNNTFFGLEPMPAQHGTDCSAPTNTHTVSTYEGAVFQCRDHVMTAMKAEGYGVIYLTPDHMMDFSQGTSTMSFDISTLRTSGRDWWDVWITPFDSNVQLVGENWYPDLNGKPRDSIRIGQGANGNIGAEITSNFNDVVFPGMQNGRVTGDTTTSYDSFLTPSSSTRTTFQVQISRTHLKVGMPAAPNSAGQMQQAFWWIDTDIPPLSWDTGVVQFGHHSYNPTKDCGSGNPPGPDGQCKANTWHWDNVTINPATPFTMLRANRRYVAQNDVNQVSFAAPASEGSFLRFSGIGGNLQFSTNGGASWQSATAQATGKQQATEHFQSYWTPVPQGTQSVLFRGETTWAGNWQARDIAIWSRFNPPTVNIPNIAASTEFIGYGPERFLETRSGEPATVDGQSNAIGRLAAGSVTRVKVAGRRGVPANAKAVTLNITATESRSAGFITAYPCGIGRPTASNINFAAGQTIAGSITTSTGPNGEVCLFTNVDTQLIADVTGYYPANSSFQPISPTRYLETRAADAATFDGQYWGAGRAGAGATVQLPVAGRGAVPRSATAVALNVTATGGTADGFITVYPCDSGRPNASNLNFPAGGTVANSVISKVSAAGTVCIFTNVATNIVADVSGYFQAGSPFVALNPARLMETRSGQNPTADGRYRSLGQRTTNSVTELIVNSRGGAPIESSDAVLNITATGSATAGFVTVYPCGSPRPLASNLNFAAGQTVANSVLTRIGPGGKVCVFTNNATHLIVDVNGAFTGAVISGLANRPVAAAPVAVTLPLATTPVRNAESLRDSTARSDSSSILCRIDPAQVATRG